MDTHEISVGARDVPPETAAVHNTEAQLLNTTKPIGIGPLSGMECNAILRMCAEVVGGARRAARAAHRVRRRLPRQPAQAAAATPPRSSSSARAGGIPDNILSMAMAGGSSPVTLAGTLVTHNAEVLAASCSPSSPSAAAR